MRDEERLIRSLDGELSELEASALRERLLAEGVGPGMGVGVRGRDSRGFVVSMFAALGCGAVVMPLSHELPGAEIDEMLRSFPLHAVLDDGSAVRPIDGPRLRCTALVRRAHGTRRRRAPARARVCGVHD